MSIADRLARGMKATLVTRLLWIVANAALMILLTRYLLTPASYGLLYLALSVLGVAAIFGTLGLPKSTARYVTAYVEESPDQVPHVLRRSIAYQTGLVIVVGTILVATSGRVATLVGEPALGPFLVLGAAYIAARTFMRYCSTVFQGFNRVTLSAVLRAVNGVARLVFAVGFILIGFGALGALLGYIVGFAVAALVGILLLYTRFYVETAAADRPEPGLFRRIRRYSVPTTATEASVVLDSKVDKILVGALLNTTAVGYYTLAGQVADLVIVPAQSLGFTISPALGEQKAEGSVERAGRIYQRSLELVLLVYVPAGVGLVLVAEPTITTIFGAAYREAVPVLQIFGVFVVVRAVDKVTGNGLDYLGLARVRAVGRGIAAVSNVGLNLLLIPPFGIVGAAVATVVTYSTYAGINLYYIHRELAIGIRRLARTVAIVGAIATVMALSVLGAMPYVSTLPTLAGVVLLGGAVWAILAVTAGLIDPAEVRSFLL